MVASFTASAQKNDIHLEQVKLDSALRVAERIFQVQFIYSKELIQKAHPVSLKLKNADLNAFIHACLVDQPISFFLSGSFIVLRWLEKERPPDTPSYFIRGIIVDDAGQPIPAATVMEEFSNNTVQAGQEGYFSIAVASTHYRILVSCVGYETVLLESPLIEFLKVRLKPKPLDLEETIVKGLYSTPAYSNTGSISLVKSHVLQSMPVQNVLAATQGRAAGVYINTENGLPGGNLTIQIRGPHSLNAGNAPLFLVDGIPFENSPLNKHTPVLTTGSVGPIHPLSIIPAEEIHSISFLKDADATALYGARSGNGVVLIQTKNAVREQAGSSVTVKQGFSRISQFTNLLNLEQYLAYRREAFVYDSILPTPSNAPELLRWDTTNGRNWQKYLFGEWASYTNLHASLQASHAALTYRLGVSLHNQGSVSPGDNSYTRGSVHLQLALHPPKKNWNTKLTLLTAIDQNRQMAFNATAALTLPPNIPLFTREGKISWDGFTSNAHPYALQFLRSNASNGFFQSALKTELRLNAELLFKVNMGGNYINLRQDFILPWQFLNPGLTNKGLPNYGQNIHQSWMIEPHLHFLRKKGAFELQSTVGVSWQNGQIKGLTQVDSLHPYKQHTNYSYAAGFAQLLLSWKKQLTLNLVLRRDASSRFGPANRTGNFGALGFSWVFPFGKFRTSYGLTGNDQIGDFSYLATFSNGRPQRFANDNISWETIKKMEAAVELNFLEQRIKTTLVWYHNRSSNQLVQVPVPFASGPFGFYLTNYPALIENKGWEVELACNLMKTKKLTWTLEGNLSLPSNRLLKYPNLTSNPALSYQIGKDITTRKGYQFLGVNPSNGQPLFKDQNSDQQLNELDLVSIGKLTPDFFGGCGSSVKFKRLAFDLYFHFVKKQMPVVVHLQGGNGNRFLDALRRWSQPGDITNVPAATTLRSPSSLLLSNSSAAYANASYTRLKSFQASWFIPAWYLQKWKVPELKCFIEAVNLCTWHKGGNFFDPETNLLGVPPLQTILIGMQIKI